MNEQHHDVSTDISELQAIALAVRMLAGTGLATLTAYRSDGTNAVRSMSHRLAGSDLLVTLPEPATDGFDADVVDVRLHIRKEAALAAPRVVLADLHTLGEAELVSRSATGTTTWRVQFDSVLIHHTGGVDRIPMSQLWHRVEPLTAAATSRAELIALEDARSWGQVALRKLAERVLLGEAHGMCTELRSLPPGFPANGEHAMAIDVSSVGVTVMLMDRAGLQTVLALTDPVGKPHTKLLI